MQKKVTRSDLFGRREALQLFGVGLTAATGLVVLGGGAARAEGEALSCKKVVAVDEAGAALRRSSQYKEKSIEADKVCTKCSQWENGKFGACGGCKILPGAVHPEGTCLSFAPIGSTPPAK